MTKHYTKAPSNRQLKVSQEIRNAISSFFSHGEYFHPFFEKTYITIEEVRISPDLKIATAFVVFPDNTDEKAAKLALLEISPEVRKAITSKVKLKFSPEIRFVIDNTSKKAQHIDHLLDAVTKKQEK